MNERPGLRPTALASLLWLALATGAGAQVHVSRTLSVQDGLVHPQVLSIGEDREGFLWFGTLDGASRFDGLEFVNFQKEDGLPGNEVHAIFQVPGGPPAGRWGGTPSAGADVFNVLNAQKAILLDQRWGFQEAGNASPAPVKPGVRETGAANTADVVPVGRAGELLETDLTQRSREVGKAPGWGADTRVMANAPRP